jgi:phosphoribosyl 1,2-cyclic phosphate phosphodiesterase
VTILGCGGSAGVPSLGGPDGAGDWGACDPTEPRNRRSRASIVLHGPAGNVLVDTGPDMRAQILANRVPRIDSIIYTHAHADHILGFDDVRLLNRVINRPIPTFLTQPTLTELSRRFDYAFKRVWEPPMFLWPVVIPTIIEAGQGIHAGGLHIDTFEQDHEVTKTLGLRVEKFAYSTDVIRFSDEAWSSLAGIDTWLVGCFQRTPHWTHAHLDLVLQWRTRLNIRRTVLTHMGYDMDWSWLQSNLPPDVEVAHDGLILHVT